MAATEYRIVSVVPQANNSAFKVTFEFGRSIGVETVKITFIDQKKIKSVKGYIVVQNEVQAQTQRYTYLTASEKSTSQAITTTGTVVVAAALGSSVSVVAFGAASAGGAGLLISLLGIFQTVNYLVFINVNYPQNVVWFFNLFSVASFTFIPDPIRFLFPGLADQMEVRLNAPQKFLDNGMDGRFLNNSGIMVATWALYLMAYLLIKGLLFAFRMSGRVTRALLSVKSSFEWGLIYGTLLGSFAALYLSAVLNFLTPLNTASSIIGLIALVACLLTPFLITSIIYHAESNLESSHIQKKFGVLYEGLRIDESENSSVETSFYRRNFMSIILLRKIVDLSGLVVAYDVALLQLAISIVGDVVIIFLILKLKPYGDRRGYIQNIGTELLIFLAHLTITIYAGDDITNSLTDEQRKAVGWAVIGFSGALLAFNATFALIDQFNVMKGIFLSIAKYCKKKQLNKLKGADQPPETKERSSQALEGLNDSHNQNDNHPRPLKLISNSKDSFARPRQPSNRILSNINNLSNTSTDAMLSKGENEAAMGSDMMSNSRINLQSNIVRRKKRVTRPMPFREQFLNQRGLVDDMPIEEI
eukprot:CAMPEP_0176460976 /NCGR_PEP_ID=MMETSP0127-20121128/34352_1 /TAXON_ID=938130 /ORGANISM="Platyophrya macrostoma, Strain WH" /LENGTH=587 /DNA_ID=CAMNT_0017852525 /DNA_START=735 /DNA_END=2498 /DNA_ORIENTATION=+